MLSTFLLCRRFLYDKTGMCNSFLFYFIVYWEGKKISDLMVNEQIRDREVRVIGENGEQLGIMPSREAMRLAEEAGLDLVKIAPTAKPPVCKIVDYGKFRYEQTRKEKEAKRAKENKVVELAVANASMDIPDAMVNEQVRRMAEDFSRRLQSQGLTMEQYMQFTGMTADKLLEQMRPEALKRIQNSLVLEAIAKAENIQVSEERLDEEYAKMAQQYKMEVEKIKEIMDSYAKEQMKNDLAIQAAVEMITEAAKEVEAAKAE